MQPGARFGDGADKGSIGIKESEAFLLLTFQGSHERAFGIDDSPFRLTERLDADPSGYGAFPVRGRLLRRDNPLGRK